MELNPLPHHLAHYYLKSYYVGKRMIITMKDYRIRALTGYNPNQARKDEKDYAIRQFREFIDNNNPPLLGDLIIAMKRVTSFGYAGLPELLMIVNAKIYPLRVVVDESSTPTYQHIKINGYKHYLNLVDTLAETYVSVSIEHLFDSNSVALKRGDFAVHQDGFTTSYKLKLIPLEPKQHRVLAALLSSFTVVSFEELFDVYWAEDNAADEKFLDSAAANKARKQQLINNCIGQIRKTLKFILGSSANPIESRPRIGYQFMA